MGKLGFSLYKGERGVMKGRRREEGRKIERKERGRRGMRDGEREGEREKRNKKCLKATFH